jgi:hypothetical protein
LLHGIGLSRLPVIIEEVSKRRLGACPKLDEEPGWEYMHDGSAGQEHTFDLFE